MTESKKAREEREAAEAAAAAQVEDGQVTEPIELATEGFDVTQRPTTELDDKGVDYAKTTMNVVGDDKRPVDFDPQANR